MEIKRGICKAVRGGGIDVCCRPHGHMGVHLSEVEACAIERGERTRIGDSTGGSCGWDMSTTFEGFEKRYSVGTKERFDYELEERSRQRIRDHEFLKHER